MKCRAEQALDFFFLFFFWAVRTEATAGRHGHVVERASGGALDIDVLTVRSGRWPAILEISP
jgi:hypothetical protein